MLGLDRSLTDMPGENVAYQAALIVHLWKTCRRWVVVTWCRSVTCEYGIQTVRFSHT